MVGVGGGEATVSLPGRTGGPPWVSIGSGVLVWVLLVMCVCLGLSVDVPEVLWILLLALVAMFVLVL